MPTRPENSLDRERFTAIEPDPDEKEDNQGFEEDELVDEDIDEDDDELDIDDDTDGSPTR
jgi:hypothetical protein